MTILPWPRRTNIVCTMGPACKGSVLPRLVTAGMNVARLNFSHGAQEEHGDWIRRIRGVSERLKVPVAIRQELAGPKVSIDAVPGGETNLRDGEKFYLSADGGGNARLISRFRLQNRTIGLTSRAETWRRPCLTWGVLPLLPPTQDIDERLRLAEEVTVQAGLLHSGDRVIITAGTPIGTRGTTNLIKAATIT